VDNITLNIQSNQENVIAKMCPSNGHGTTEAILVIIFQKARVGDILPNDDALDP
jgi:hypothetical protein